MIIRNTLSFIKGKGMDNKSRFSNSSRRTDYLVYGEKCNVDFRMQESAGTGLQTVGLGLPVGVSCLYDIGVVRAC